MCSRANLIDLLGHALQVRIVLVERVEARLDVAKSLGYGFDLVIGD